MLNHSTLCFVALEADDGCDDGDNGGCEHICINHYDGRYECRCRPGYRLDDDSRSCPGISIPSSLSLLIFLLYQVLHLTLCWPVFMFIASE